MQQRHKKWPKSNRPTEIVQQPYQLNNRATTTTCKDCAVKTNQLIAEYKAVRQLNVRSSQVLHSLKITSHTPTYER